MVDCGLITPNSISANSRLSQAQCEEKHQVPLHGIQTTKVPCGVVTRERWSFTVTRTGCLPSFFAASRPPTPPPTMPTCGTVGGVSCPFSFIGVVPICVEIVSVIALRPLQSLAVAWPPPLIYQLFRDRRHRCGPTAQGCRAIRFGRASRVWQDQQSGGHQSVPGQEWRAAARAAPRWPTLAGYMQLGIPPEILSAHGISSECFRRTALEVCSCLEHVHRNPCCLLTIAVAS